MAKDLFGNEIKLVFSKSDDFLENSLSVLDAKNSNWQRRNNKWKSLGIKSEIGRKINARNVSATTVGIKDDYLKKIWNKTRRGELISEQEEEEIKYFIDKGNNTSIFSPYLCEVLYKWFAPENGTILDPFAGGSVRGIVANYLGYKYTGIDIRQEQIDSNREQALDILDVNNQPNWYVGDSNEILNGFNKVFDFVFSCPPYSDLEVYSDLEKDISNMPYNEFMKAYEEIIEKSCNLLKSGCYACFVVGEVRDKKGNYICFVPDTINAFRKCGMYYYNEIILTTPIGIASMTVSSGWKNKKVGKVHQNVLVFKKP